ncbi:MAG: hypothetical protein V4757_10295 [Pseudomonadota bacterium]
MKYAKTLAGQQAMKDRQGVLAARLRPAFILFDGQRTLMQVLEATQGMGVTQADLDGMIALGLLEPAQGQATPVAAPLDSAGIAGNAAAGPVMSDMERYQLIYPIAARLTGSLGLRGFRLNLAVEGAGNWSQLEALMPRILEAAGPERAMALQQALDALR